MSGQSSTRVVLVSDSAVFGGAESYLVQLAEGLSSRYVLDLVATDPVPARLVDAIRSRRGRVLVAPKVAGKFDLPGILAFAGALRAASPDLVHVNLNSSANNRHAAAIASLRWPTVATLHIDTEISTGLHRLSLPLAFIRVTRLIAVSQATARQLHEELRVPQKKIAVIANGVDDAPEVTIRERPEALRIGGLGRLTRQKGFDLLIEAIAILESEGLSVEAVIAGEGPERMALEGAASGLPVTLQGWVERGAFLAGLDVFCLPSRWEGLPFALLEAMMRGLPCVCTDVGDVADAAGDACLIVAPEDPRGLADALRTLATSPVRRRELGAAARERVRRDHSAAAMVRATAAIYDELAPVA